MNKECITIINDENSTSSYADLIQPKKPKAVNALTDYNVE